MANITPFPAGLVALSLTACGVAGAATMTGGTPARAAAEPLACALVVTERGGIVDVAAMLRSAVPMTGDYNLRLQSAGLDMDQGGPFAAAPGETLTLGSSMLSGRAADLTARFTVTAGGQIYDCPVASEF